MTSCRVLIACAGNIFLSRSDGEPPAQRASCGLSNFFVDRSESQQESQRPSQLTGAPVAMEAAFVRGIGPRQKLNEDGRMASGGLPRKHSS